MRRNREGENGSENLILYPKATKEQREGERQAQGRTGRRIGLDFIWPCM